MSNVVALYDNVILRPVEDEEKFIGNIMLPDEVSEGCLKAEIVSIGPGKWSLFIDKFLSTTFLVGDVVLVPKIGPLRFTIEGKEHFTIKEEQILAKYNN